MAVALLILDMQKYFFRSAEKQAGCARLLPALDDLLELASGAGAQVWSVLSVHKADRSSWSRNMLRHDAGCLLEGTPEAEAVEGLRVVPGQQVVHKTRHSAFVRTGLEARLRAGGVDRVVLAGVYTHGCVSLTAVDAWSLDFEVAVARDAVFSHRPDVAAFCEERLRGMFAIPFLSNEELRRSWLASA